MKIVEMRVTPIAIADAPLLNIAGLHAPYALRTIVEIVSEDGITGAAETHGGQRVQAAFEQAREQVIGRTAWDLTRAPGDMAQLLGSSTRPAAMVASALEVAALDLIGKALGVPVAELLGGRVRDAVPFSAYLFYKLAGGGGEGEDEREDRYGEALDPAGVVAQAQAFVAEYGFTSIKLKGGVFPPDQEIAAIKAMADAFGLSMPLRIDPNGGWTAETSIRVGRELRGILEYLEDPASTMADMAATRAALLADGNDTPLATNMVVTAWDHIPEAVATDAVQVILADHHYWGGLRAITHLGKLAQTFGLGLSMHSNSHLGLSLLAMTHVAAATPNLTYAADTHYPWQDAADEILEGGRVPIRDGMVTVPTAPGLGANLDQDALARGKERYERVPYRERDDRTPMRQRVDPAWEFKLARW
jgi:glucarate dehydratase